MPEADPELVRLLRELQDCTDGSRRKQLRYAIQQRSINKSIEALNTAHCDGTLKVVKARGGSKNKQLRRV